jgi:hypothetical protein
MLRADGAPSHDCWNAGAVLAITVVTLPDTVALWLVAGSAIVAVVILQPLIASLLLPFAVAFGSLVSISARGVKIGSTDLLVGALTAHNVTDDPFLRAIELQFSLSFGCFIALLRMSTARPSS